MFSGVQTQDADVARSRTRGRRRQGHRARDLAEVAAQIASFKGEASAYLGDPTYNALRHRLEIAHAAVEAATVEARRRVRLNEGR